MKSIRNKVGLLLLLIFIGGSMMYAQPGPMHMMAGLSDDQKAQIQKLRISHLKDIQGLNNQIRENRAHFKTLMTAENPDMNAINKNIDEFGNLRSQVLKKQASHIQDIRKILKDEQRLMFDKILSEKGINAALHPRFMAHKRMFRNHMTNSPHADNSTQEGSKQ